MVKAAVIRVMKISGRLTGRTGGMERSTAFKISSDRTWRHSDPLKCFFHRFRLVPADVMATMMDVP